LRHVVIPRAAGKAVQPVKVQAKAAHTTATKASAQAASTSKALTTYKTSTNTRLNTQTATLHRVTTVVIPGINTELDRVSSDQAKLRERTTSLENGAVKTFEWIRTHALSGTTAVFAGAVAVALARLGFGFLRCRSWQRVGRRLTCGNGASMLNLLDDGLGPFLGALLTAEAIVNFRDLVKVAQTVEHGVATGLQDLLDV
jgi:hypothetical protein